MPPDTSKPTRYFATGVFYPNSFMLTETTHTLTGLPGELYDIDLTQSDEWTGVTTHSVIFGSGAVELPQPIQFPKVAAIDSETVVVVNSRTVGESNAWIVSASGDVLATFFAGDAVSNVLGSGRFLVFTYFDESAATSPGIEGNGVAVFDTVGNYLFGYREVFGVDAVDVFDCYAACWADDDQIYFFSYTDFPLVRLDLDSKAQEKWETPHELHGAHAISTIASTVYFHAPYADKSGVYAWEIGNERAERIGERHWNMRGIRSGRFLAVGKSGFTIITPSS